MAHDRPDFGCALATLAQERLTARQKEILRYLDSGGAARSATFAARELRRSLQCSATTVWNNLAALRRAGLIAYASGRGEPLRLTAAGRHVVESVHPV